MTISYELTRWTRGLLAALLLATAGLALAQADDQRVLDARDALRKKDGAKLIAARTATALHPLAQ
jgi:hypothetical protein